MAEWDVHSGARAHMQETQMLPLGSYFLPVPHSAQLLLQRSIEHRYQLKYPPGGKANYLPALINPCG